jgi:hypothetical protein
MSSLTPNSRSQELVDRTDLDRFLYALELIGKSKSVNHLRLLRFLERKKWQPFKVSDVTEATGMHRSEVYKVCKRWSEMGVLETIEPLQLSDEDLAFIKEWGVGVGSIRTRIKKLGARTRQFVFTPQRFADIGIQAKIDELEEYQRYIRAFKTF